MCLPIFCEHVRVYRLPAATTTIADVAGGNYCGRAWFLRWGSWLMERKKAALAEIDE